jgi:hypothetical protein
MPHITTCPKCGKLYEAQSEEAANEPDICNPQARWCRDCVYVWRANQLARKTFGRPIFKEHAQD